MKNFTNSIISTINRISEISNGVIALANSKRHSQSSIISREHKMLLCRAHFVNKKVIYEIT